MWICFHPHGMRSTPCVKSCECKRYAALISLKARLETTSSSETSDAQLKCCSRSFHKADFNFHSVVSSELFTQTLRKAVIKVSPNPIKVSFRQYFDPQPAVVHVKHHYSSCKAEKPGG